MKKVVSSSTNTQLTNSELSELGNIYSKLLTASDLIDIERDRFYQNDRVRNDLLRCYRDVNSAIKRLDKYCKSIYE